jgi:hypothetical protein
MKKIVTLCCVLVTLAASLCAQDRAGQSPKQQPAPPPNHGGKIEMNYDGVAHETLVALKRMSVTCEMGKGSESILKGVCVSLQAVLHCPGQQMEYVRRATLRLTFETKNWDARHPPGERDLTAVADGETIRLGPMGLAAQGVSEGWLAEDSKETLEVSIPYPAFLKLARASSVEFSVGKTAFALRDKNLAAFRDMNNRIKPPQSTAGAQSGGN